MAPLGIFLAGAGFCLALVLCLCEELLQPSTTQSQPSICQYQIDPANLKYLYKLSAQLVLLLSLVVLLDLVTHKSALVTVPLVSLAAPFFLAVVLRRTAIYYHKFHTYFTVSLPKMHNEMILFSAIGFFGYALGMSAEVSRYILALVNHLGFTSPLTIIPLVDGPGDRGWRDRHPPNCHHLHHRGYPTAGNHRLVPTTNGRCITDRVYALFHLVAIFGHGLLFAFMATFLLVWL